MEGAGKKRFFFKLMECMIKVWGHTPWYKASTWTGRQAAAVLSLGDHNGSHRSKSHLPRRSHGSQVIEPPLLLGCHWSWAPPTDASWH